MDCVFIEFCGRQGKRTHIMKGSGQFDVEVIYLCPDCVKECQEVIKKITQKNMDNSEIIPLVKQYKKDKVKMNTFEENKILIPLSSEDQKFVESVCTNGAYTFQSFFQHLLALYKRSLNEPLARDDTKEEISNRESENKKKSSKK